MKNSELFKEIEEMVKQFPEWESEDITGVAKIGSKTLVFTADSIYKLINDQNTAAAASGRILIARRGCTAGKKLPRIAAIDGPAVGNIISLEPKCNAVY